MIPIVHESGGFHPTILILTNGQEIIGELKGTDDANNHYLLDYPQVIHWWKNDSEGNGPGYEFLPYVFGAIIQMSVPVSCKHVITKVAPDQQILADYRSLIEDIHDRQGRYEAAKRALKDIRERSQGSDK